MHVHGRRGNCCRRPPCWALGQWHTTHGRVHEALPAHHHDNWQAILPHLAGTFMPWKGAMVRAIHLSSVGWRAVASAVTAMEVRGRFAKPSGPGSEDSLR